MKPPPGTDPAFVEMVDRELEQARVRALETLRAPWPKPERRTRTRAPRRMPAWERVLARQRGEAG